MPSLDQYIKQICFLVACFSVITIARRISDKNTPSGIINVSGRNTVTLKPLVTSKTSYYEAKLLQGLKSIDHINERNWTTPSSMEPDKKNRLPICLGIIVYQGVKTLENTLSSFKRVELFDQVNEMYILFQKIDSSGRRAYADSVIARYPSLHPIYEKRNIGFKSFIRLQEYCNNSEMSLIVEEDFAVSSKLSAQDVHIQLSNAVWLLRRETDAVRMRSRRDPGYPNWSYEGWKKTKTVGSTHLISYVFWDDYPEKHVPEIWVCRKEPKTWCALSANAHYTNNPTMYTTEFAKRLYKMIPEEHQEKNLEPWMTSIWRLQNFTVAYSDAVFTHKRIDRTIGTGKRKY